MWVDIQLHSTDYPDWECLVELIRVRKEIPGVNPTSQYRPQVLVPNYQCLMSFQWSYSPSFAFIYFYSPSPFCNNDCSPPFIDRVYNNIHFPITNLSFTMLGHILHWKDLQGIVVWAICELDQRMTNTAEKVKKKKTTIFPLHRCALSFIILQVFAFLNILFETASLIYES